MKISKILKNLKLSKKFRTIFFLEIFRFFEVCSRGDLVVFLGLCSSGDLERISEIKSKGFLRWRFGRFSRGSF